MNGLNQCPRPHASQQFCQALAFFPKYTQLLRDIAVHWIAFVLDCV